MDPAGALALHSYVLCVLVAIGLYAFARRLTRDRGAATLALVLFLLGGGLGWIATAAAVEGSHDLRRDAHDAGLGAPRQERPEHAVRQHVLRVPGVAARLPLRAAAGLRDRLDAAGRRPPRPTSGCSRSPGSSPGLLPLAHLGTLLALAIVTPFLFLLFPSRAWLAFFGIWMAIAVPQLLPQLGGGAGALSSLRIQVGWVAPPDPWPWFWLKNLGWFIPLLLVGLAARRVDAASARIGSCGRSCRSSWRSTSWSSSRGTGTTTSCSSTGSSRSRSWSPPCSPASGDGIPTSAPRTLVAGVIVSMMLSGVLEDVGTLLGQSRYRMLEPDELALATEVRARTDPDCAVRRRDGEPRPDRDADRPPDLCRLRELALDRGHPVRGAGRPRCGRSIRAHPGARRASRSAASTTS